MKHHLKTLFCVTILLGIILTLSACGNDETKQPENSQQKNKSQTANPQEISPQDTDQQEQEGTSAQGKQLSTPTFATYKALGNEPGWIVEIEETVINIQTDYGENKFSVAPVTPQTTNNGHQYLIQTETQAIEISVVNKICHDDMSGLPFPDQVTLIIDDKKYQGCGGDPLDLLVGHEWHVEDIANQGIIDRSNVTLNFYREGRVSGSSSCNSYSAEFVLTGESLTFKDSMGTLRACAPALMNQEQKFLQMLSNVQNYNIDGFGALILTTQDGKTITARIP